jgi:hypothetical protein
MARQGIWKLGRKFLMLGVLVVCVAYFSLPTESSAFVCYGVKTTERYYSDATYTVKVGMCVENECKGTYVCSGQQTDFAQVTTQAMLCSLCDPACGQCN